MRNNRDNEEWSVVKVLQHTRHDWLNQIQLIKGYLTLGNIDEANRVLDNVVVQAQQETHLCNLNMPQFCEMLLTYNWSKRVFYLEYEILEEQIESDVDDAALTTCFQSIFSKIESYAKQYAENYLYLSIKELNNDLCFFLEFSGIITDIEALTEELRHIGVPFVKRLEIHAQSENELLFEVFI